MPEEYIDGEILELDDNNFGDLVYGSNEIWMLKFSAPWCYHCQKMKPSWVAAAKELGSNVRFATINAADNRGLAKEFGITMLPSIKFFRPGYGKSADVVENYSGTRDQHALTTFAHGLADDYHSNPSAYAYQSDIQFGPSTYTSAPLPGPIHEP